MNDCQWIESLGNIDEVLIEEALEYKKDIKKVPVRKIIAVITACVVFTICVVTIKSGRTDR